MVIPALCVCRSLGSGSIPVQTLCVRFHPTDTNHLFVGTDEVFNLMLVVIIVIIVLFQFFVRALFCTRLVTVDVPFPVSTSLIRRPTAPVMSPR